MASGSHLLQGTNIMCRTITLLALLMVLHEPAVADWPHWRGPQYDGSNDAARNLPTEFSPDKNLRWSADLPGPAAATPIVVDDRVFVASTGPGDALLAMAFDLKSGGLLWSHEVGRAKPKDGRSTQANPSPVSDGKTVAFFYSSGQMAGFSPSGEKLWQRSITDDYGDFAFMWTFASSPTLHNGQLILPILQRDSPVRGHGKKGAKSFVLMIDPATGRTIRQIDRPTRAKGESMESYTTVVPATLAGRDSLVLAGGDALTLHDGASGAETWRWETYNPKRRDGRRLVATPVVCEGLVIVCAPRGEPTYAVRPGQAEPVWVAEDKDLSSDVASPLSYRGKLYLLNGEKQVLSCLDPETGKVNWKTDVKGNLLRGSPLGADGRIYVLNHDGEVFVVDADGGKLLATNRLTDGSDKARSSIVAAEDCLLVRTDSKLYCFAAE